MAEVIVGGGGFSNGFSYGFNSSLQVCTISATAPEPSVAIVIVEISDWDECTDLPGDYWQKDTSCYDRDKELYSTIQTNAWNNLGVETEYLVTDYNTSYDSIFGEDRDRYIIRSFDLMTYYELPREQELWTRFGIEGIDNFHMYVSKEHMAYASSYSASVSSVFDSHTPTVGDIIKAKYNEYYYEILSVKQYDNQFLQAQHSWDLTVRPFRNEHLTLSASVATNEISAIVSATDILDITDVVDTQTSAILYTISAGEGALPDPFSDW